MADFTVTEQDIAVLVDKLPDESWLKQYLYYAVRQSDASLAYHIGVGLAVLAAVAPPTLCIDTLPGGKVSANLWVLIVGRPAVDHKSTAIRIGRELLAWAVPLAIGEDPASYEGLLESLGQQPNQLLVMGEFGDFLSKTEGGSNNYMAKIKAGLTRIFDGDPIERRLAKRTVRIPSPRLSILAAVNPSYLETHAEMQDWEGGFMSRWMLIHAHRERELYAASPDDARREWLVQWLVNASNASVGRCMGLDPAAAQRWYDWCRDLAKRLEQDQSLARVAAHGRTATHAAKMALLIALDCGQARSAGQWMITDDILEVAIGMAELHYKSAMDLAALAASGRDMRERRNVLRAIGTDWVPYGSVLRGAELLRSRADRIIETLVEEGAIESHLIGTRMHFRRRLDDTALSEPEWASSVSNLMAVARGMTQDPDDLN
jgi:hypothetical protein